MTDSFSEGYILMKISSIPPEVFEQWQNIVELMSKIMKVPSAIITWVHLPYIDILLASRNPDNPYHQGAKVEIANHFCEWVVMHREPMILPNAHKSPLWMNAPEIEQNMISYMGFPIFWPSGKIFGTICVLDNKENHFTDEFKRMIELLRNMVQSHLELIVQKNELVRKNRELELRQEEIHRLRDILQHQRP